jgi:hypothetical protein
VHDRKLSRRRAWYVLLLAPYVGLLWVPFYAQEKPRLFGFPFFYWYQFAWVIAAAVLTAIVWLAVRPSGGYGGVVRGEPAAPAPGGPPSHEPPAGVSGGGGVR